MLIIKAKNIIPKEKMKNIYETLFKQMQHGLVLVDDSYEISIVEPSMEWIPVSERLPEKDMPCLVSVGKLYLTQIAIYSDLMGTIDHKIFYQGDYGYGNFENITEYIKAWMPLPEPYKAESEEKENG